MANRGLSQNQRKKVYRILLKRDPEICCSCQRTCHELGLKPFNLLTGKGGLLLHHVKYVDDLTDPDYVRFICVGCNNKKELQKKMIYDEQRMDQSHIENKRYSNAFDEYWWMKMQEKKYHYGYLDMLRGGAKYTGANISTIRRYIDAKVGFEDSDYVRMVVDLVDTIYLNGTEPTYHSKHREEEFSDDDKHDMK